MRDLDTTSKPSAAASQRRDNLAIEAHQRLKRDIIRGHFMPGERLRMTTLKERYALSISPLREALAHLVAEQLVIAISQRGYRVAPMSIAELNDIYDARAQLEGLMVGLAIERGDDGWEAEILARAHHLNLIDEQHPTAQRLESWDQRHAAFHDALVSGCGSAQLLNARAGLFDKVQRYRHLWLTETVFSDQALHDKRLEHSALVEVVLSRQGDAAERLMREHLMTPVPIITAIMQDRGLN